MLNSILYIVAGLVLAGVILLLYKFPIARLFVLTAVMVLLVFTGITSAFRLNTYYNSKGGIIGQITGVYKENETTVTETTQIDFDFKNVSLTKNEKDKYSAKFSTDKTLTLNDNEFYQILVNGEPTQLILSDKNSAVANYTYVFQSNELVNNNYKEIAIDTMTISFSFYGNYSSIICEINGGTNTASLWDSYFTKNNFKISIIKVNDIEISKTSELKTITLLIDGNVSEIIKIKTGSNYILANTINDNRIVWKLDNNVIDKIENISSDLTIYGETIKVYTIVYRYNHPYYGDDFNSDFITYTECSEDEVLTYFPQDVSIGDKFEFLGWSLDGKTVYDFTNFTPTSDTEIFAIWKMTGLKTTLITNGGTAKINGEVYGDNSVVLVDFEEHITISDLTKDGFKGKVIVYFENKTNNQFIINEPFTYKEYYYTMTIDNEYDRNPDITETKELGELIIEILWRTDGEYTEWTNKELEESIFYSFDILPDYYDKGANYKFNELSEKEFLDTLYQVITEEQNTMTVSETKEYLLNFIFDYSVNLELDFRQFMLIVYEKSKNETYTINYVTNGGIMTSSKSYPTIAKYNEEIRISTMEKIGYKFTGYKITGLKKGNKYYKIGNKITEIESEVTEIIVNQSIDTFYCFLNSYGNIVTFEALYEPIKYNVQINLNYDEASNYAPFTYSYDESFNIPNYTRIGYKFLYWTITGMDMTTHYIGEEETTSTYIETNAVTFKNLRGMTGTVTFTAHWEKIDEVSQMSIYELQESIIAMFNLEVEKFEELSEAEFYREVWGGVSKDWSNYSVSEYREMIASSNFLNFKYEKNIDFHSYLVLMYKAILEI